MEKKNNTAIQTVFTAVGCLVGIFFVLIGGLGFIWTVLALFGFGPVDYGDLKITFFMLVMTLTWAVMGALFLKALLGRDYGKIPRIILAFVGIHIILFAFSVIVLMVSLLLENISLDKGFGLFYFLLWFVLGGTLLYVSRAKKLSLRSFMPFWIMLLIVLIVTVLLFLIAGDSPTAIVLKNLFSYFNGST